LKSGTSEVTPPERAARAARIRRATPADATVLSEMLGELADDQGQRDSVAVTPERLHELLHRDDVIVLIAERDYRPLGYVSAVRQLNIWAGAELVALDDLYVREEARNAGVGRELMLGLAAHADRTGAIVRWEAETGNAAAHRFYERLGAALRTKVIAAWRPVDYRAALYAPVGEPALPLDQAGRS